MDRDYELQTHRAEDRHWWYRGRRQVLERVIANLRLPARARILDAGCGSGRNMLELARHGTVTGVELSATSVALARERSAGEVIEGSVLSMPFDVGELRSRRLPGCDRAPAGRPGRPARAAPRRRSGRRPARHRSRLSVAVERSRRDQPSSPPLHPPHAAAGRRAGRLGDGAHHLLQLAAAARRDRAARARPVLPEPRPSRASICGSPPRR